ncbi:HVO_A0556 family zinc finger protein [Halospeciosus flavus]|uniref:HVO_A0556 family zinc finger protein n=1 Tax=Halospeciosus flavus TaxID=3032283 RepID=A0ABD5Z610_9EURY|nr:HVO_A0556 family zinc finger protein [Halospeciosus flavus]
MSQSSTSVDTSRSVFETLVGTSCHFCDDGRLARDEYKGNDAVVCDACETPAVQSW